jgi:hypothetical protein
MRSIERRFKQINEKKPHWSPWSCFVKAIKGQKFNKKIINRWFNQLVDKDDYAKDEKKELLEYLSRVSNTLEECLK